MSAKDQIKQIVDYFKREPQLKDKTDGMAEGLLLGANLADEANERSKDAKETTLAVQEKYKEQILTHDLNPNKDPELVDIRDGSTTAGERIRKFEQETNRQLAQKSEQTDLEVERKRIDNFVKLTEGSTTGDAELIDARIGADGFVFTSLGGAVRGQSKNLSESVKTLNSQVGGKSNLEFVNGVLYNGVAYTDQSLFRIVTTKYNVFEYDVMINVKSTGFYYVLSYKSNTGVYLDEFGNKVAQTLPSNTDYYLPANTEFRIMVRETVDRADVVADVKSFKEQLKITDRIRYQYFGYSSTINTNTPIESFPLGVSTYLSRTSDNGGFPTSAGTLETHRGHDVFSSQIWTDYNSNNIYRRHLTSQSKWSEWEKTSGTHLEVEIGSKLITSNLSEFPTGVTHVDISRVSDNGGFPSSAGTLETHRFDVDSGFSYQIFRDFFNNDIYYRKFNESGEPFDFLKMANEKTGEKYASKVENSVRKPLITFISDDGMTTDYNILKPMSEKYGVPFTTAIITNSIGQTVDGQPRMSKQQLKELNDDFGWEFLSHTHTHVKLGEQSEVAIRSEAVNSINALKNIGLSCEGIVYPEGSSSPLARRVLKDYFKYGIRVQDDDIKINTECVPSFYIVRSNLGSFFDKPVEGAPATNTLDYYKYLVDLAIEKNGWLVFEMHTWRNEFDLVQQQHLDDLLAYIQTTTAKVVNPTEAFEVFGNQIESGDFLGKRNITGYAVSKTGQRMGGFQPWFNDEMTITNSMIINEFPKNKTSTYPISDHDGSGILHGFPTAYGTLEVRYYRTADFGNQTWYSGGTDEVFFRRALADGTWNSWKSVNFS